MLIKEKTRSTLAFYLMISPWLIVFLVLSLFPLLYGLYLSFTNYYGFNLDNLRMVGFHNYKLVFTDTDAMKALGRTFVYSLFRVPIGTATALALALLLNGQIRGMGVFRTIFYLPSIIPVITTIFLFKQLLLSSNGGAINSFLRLLGLQSVNWLGYEFSTVSLVLMSTWGSVGGALLIFLSGLKGIPSEMYESASIDGAGSFRRFFSITLPLMTPVVFFNLLMSLIGSFQVYMEPIMLTGSQLLSRPIQPIYLYAVHAFQQIFGSQRFAYGMALLWVLFGVILLVSGLVFFTNKYWVYSESEQSGGSK